MKTYSEIVIPVAMKLGALIGFCYVFSIVLPMMIPFVGSLLGLVLLFAPIVLLYKAMKSVCNGFDPEWTNGRRYSANLVSLQLINFGVVTFFFSGLIYALFIYVYTTYINPQYLADSIALSSKILSANLTIEEQVHVNEELNSITPSSMIIAAILFMGFVGLFLSVLDVIALRIKYRR